MIDTAEDDATILQCIADLQRAGLSATRSTIGHKLRRIRACHSWRVQAIARLEASGLVEMAWHLGKWGREVEVVEPAALREMVAGYRGASIRVLP